MQENIKSYNSIYQLREAFRRSGGHSDTFADEFNRLETPASLYFRIFFHFNTGYGLLNTGREFIDFDSTRLTYTENTNTATSYLYVNGEMQRKQMLDDFVTLLSNINTYSPWYFQSIDGLQDALQRSEYTGEFKIDEEPRSITIKTLEDSYDNRISTLLDLYKAVAFSKIQHKEILPANLRRFDMSIYIINTPLAYVHYGYGDVDREKERHGLNGRPPVSLTDMGDPEVTFEIPSYREWSDGSGNIFSSAKLIELQGCEIDANSAASAYTEVKSDEPFGMSHEIKITFKNVIEQRFNDTLNRIIGDYIFMDMDKEDRQSKENVWGEADTVYGSKELEGAIEKYKSYKDQRGEEIPFLFEGTDPETGETTLTELYTTPDPNDALNEYQAMMDENMRKDEVALRDVEGKLILADSALTPLPGNTNIASRYNMASISGNISRSPNIPTKDSQNIDDKYNLGIVGGLARDFLKGATDTARGYVNSKINSELAKITMGNLYWGSIIPDPNSFAHRMGRKLANKTLKPVDNAINRGSNAVHNTIRDARAAMRGWTKPLSGSSIGSNLSGNNNTNTTTGHRP